ncbi:MAG TPA: TonB family protein [Burkholderiaceae bacterium]|nr:TonB family protein [Burkholderiaceae bacterium]
MMTKTYSHYDCLNVTRDAPAEVIRAAYRSLSQKHHPDKNTGSHEAAQRMMRLNAAYSILSDSEQRRLYDLQLLNGQRTLEQHSAYQASAADRDCGIHTAATMDAPGRTSRPAPDGATGIPKRRVQSLLQQIHNQAKGWDGPMIAVLFGAISVVLIPIIWLICKNNESALRIEQGMIHAADMTPAPAPGWPAVPDVRHAPQAMDGAPAAYASRAGAVQNADPSGAGAATAALPASAQPPQASAIPGTAIKATEYARLTAMLKSMGLGLHKLALPTLAANGKPAPAPAAEPAKSAEPAPASATPTAAVPAVSAAALSDRGRVREETLRPAVPEPARSDAKPVAESGRASPAPAASPNAASASHAPRTAVIAEARNCSAPPYPINAYRNGEAGSVLLALLVASDGRVVESKVQKSSGSSELDKAARNALALCKFKPAEGQTEPTWANLTYVWSID